MSDVSMLINGEAVQAQSGAVFERRNPMDGSVASRAPAANPADAVRAVEAAAAAFTTWRQTGPGARRALLLKVADALEARTADFVAALPRETGATAMWAGFNVHLAAGMLREAAAFTTQIAGEVIPSDVPGSLAMGVRQAAGVVLGIEPPADIGYGLVDLQNGQDPTQYWLGTANFFAITQYNRSFFYAMSVVDLGRAVRTARAR